MPESLSFYEDNHFEGRMSYDRSKLKLDLSKRNVLSQASNNTNSPLRLRSPDMRLLILPSPDLERMIMQNVDLLTTPTPTDEREQFSRGFLEALQKLHENDPSNGRSAADSTTDRKQEFRTLINSKGFTTSSGVHETQVITEAPPRNSFAVKAEDPKLSVASMVTTSHSSYATTTGHFTHDGLTRNDHGRVPLKAETAHFPAPPANSTTISFPTGYTSTHDYGHSNRRLVLPMSDTNVVQPSGPSIATLNNKPSMACTSIMSGSQPLSMVDSQVGHVSSTQQTLSGPVPMGMEEGAQIVPSSTPPVPIDLNMQEAIKHERKKLRNRLAAQRCRKRKIEREEVLKSNVKELKAKHSELTTTASELRLQVCELKQKVMDHVNQGCQVFVPQSSTE